MSSDTSYPTSPPTHASQSPTHAGGTLAAAATLNSALSHTHDSNDEPIPTSLSNVLSNSSSVSSSQESNGADRRRSSIRLRLATMDPTLPAPGELAMSPVARQRAPSLSAGTGGASSGHHSRNHSLSELHQEAEYEQEAQFVRHIRFIIVVTNSSEPPQKHHSSPPSSARHHYVRE
jgi:hypothetical protein